MYEAGTTLELDYGLFRHYGISDGEGNVIHNSKEKKKVTIETIIDFAEGKKIKKSNITSKNPSLAVKKAERYLGLPYDLFSNNCEHFVRLAHGLVKESTQIQQYLVFALGAGVALKSDNDYLKIAGGATSIASLLTPTNKSPFKNAAIASLVSAGLLFLNKEFDII